MTNKEAHLALSLVPGLGRSSISRLIAHFEDPYEALTASYEEISQVEGLNPKAAKAIKGFKYEKALDQELKLIENYRVNLITIDDDDYPENLRKIFDPPALLFVRGDLRETDKYSVALIGSRKCSNYGKLVAEELALELGKKDIAVISGMARGIDSAAHKGAMDGGGRTIAVLGCGLSIVYPPENKDLMERISLNGAVISEFPMTVGPAPYNFPVRNRIISGLSLGVVVIEAAVRSGTSITVGCALEQGREAFAVPGSIHSEFSRGTHYLIKQGAKLVENVDDIIEELKLPLIGHKLNAPEEIQAPELINLNLDPEEQEVINLLSYDPVYIDEVTMNTELLPQQVLSALMTLEIKKKVIKHPGQMYSLR